MSDCTWYAIGRNVYARRGSHEHQRDPLIALCCSADIAHGIATGHNLRVPAPREAANAR